MTASEMFGVPVEGMPAMCAAAPRRSTSASSTAFRPSASPTSSASSRAEARRLHQEAISSASPASATTWTDQGLRAREHGYVSTIFGRKITSPEIKPPTPERAFNERASINAPIQGTAADIIRRAMIRMEPALAAPARRRRMLLQVHDELIFEVGQSFTTTSSR
jgi:DNA polymerase-1